MGTSQTSRLSNNALFRLSEMSKFGGVALACALAVGVSGLNVRNLNAVLRPTDFSGTWKLTDIEGDMDKFLKEMGVSWTKRTMASTMGYGKGKVINTISMEGDTLNVEVSGGAKSGSTSIKIGGGEQVLEMQGNNVKITPVWKDGAIVATTDNGTIMKRSLKGGMMLLERTKNGVSVTQKFTKQ